MHTFFTADLHFGHKKIIEYDERPFSTVEEMDETLIRNWNRKVTARDHVYILGDISFHKLDRTREILSALKGKKHWILGNHDAARPALRPFFEEIADYKEWKTPGRHFVVMSHYPIPLCNRHDEGAFMFHGHVHNNKEWALNRQIEALIHAQGIPCRMYNVGVMVQNYEPVTFEEITGLPE